MRGRVVARCCHFCAAATSSPRGLDGRPAECSHSTLGTLDPKRRTKARVSPPAWASESARTASAAQRPQLLVSPPQATDNRSIPGLPFRSEPMLRWRNPSRGSRRTPGTSSSLHRRRPTSMSLEHQRMPCRLPRMRQQRAHNSGRQRATASPGRTLDKRLEDATRAAEFASCLLDRGPRSVRRAHSALLHRESATASLSARTRRAFKHIIMMARCNGTVESDGT